MINSFRKLILFTLAFLAIGSGYTQDELEITKHAKSGNPKLKIASFSGESQLVDLVKNNLFYSDWFELVEANNSADYFLSGSLTSDSVHRIIRVEIKDASGVSVTNFELKTEQKTPLKTLVANMVDETIAQIFNTPGFCSSNIAFVKELDGKKEVWIADFDGSNPRQITYDANISVEPDWSRNNKYLVYTFYDNASTDIILIDMNNRRRKRLTRFSGTSSGAAFANNSKHIAMTLSKDRNVDLYIQNLVDGTLKRITTTPGAEASPCWSPDDKRICYVSDDGGSRPTLYLISASGGTPKRLLKLPVEAVSPDWSPVSNKICFSIHSKGSYRIAIIDMNSGMHDPEIVVSGEGDWESPSWAADGRHVVCSRSLNNQESLYLVDSLYKKEISLKSYTGNDSLPTYSDVIK